MKQIISIRDLEELLRNGGDVKSLSLDGAILTPSARDFLRDLENGQSNGASKNSSSAEKSSTPAKPVTSKSSPKEIEAFFNTPEINALKEQICEMGRRLWQRAYVDGNG